MLLGFALACIYAYAFRTETWSAKQSLIVRDDLLGQSYKPGQFDSLDSMKSAQETIFEIARKPQVIRNALQQIGPPSKGFLGIGGVGYPSEEVIEAMQGNISFSAPNGNEVGQTEVINLNTKNGSRSRAKEFTEVLVGEIIAKVNEVRQSKFQSMEAEIMQTCEVAESALENTKNKLREMDQELGQDSGSMVAMGESSFRDDPLVREIAQLNLERRGVESEVEQVQGMLKSLEAAKHDPEAIVNISSDLTSRQPALESLKREMAEQKGAYALLSGRYTDEHPAVESARDGIVVMQRQIRLELKNAISDTREQLGIKTSELRRLDSNIENLQNRLATLGEKRADSITLFADIKKRTEVLNDARTSLAKVHSLASSKKADLLTTVGGVEVSTRPDGLGKKAIILCGTLGGLMLGMGLVMMIPPPAPTSGRRRSDKIVPPVTPTPLTQTPATPATVAQEPVESAPVAPPAPATPAPVTTTPVTQSSSASSTPVTQTPETQEPAEPATAEVGTAKAGLAAGSASVLRDLVGSVKRKPKAPTQEEIEKEAEAQRIMDARLNSVKAKKDADPEPAVKPVASVSSTEPQVEKPADNPFAKDTIADSKKKTGMGAKIVPVTSNPFKKNPKPAVESAVSDTSSIAQKAVSELGAKEVEIPDVNPVQPTEAKINEMVDKAFEDELKSTTRSEAPTIQLDQLSKVIGGSALAATAATGLAALTGSDSAPGAQSASAEAGAQINPRAANIRPVDLARQAQSDEFDRVAPEGSTSPTKAENELTEKSSAPAKTSGTSPRPENPFLKNRPEKISKALEAIEDGSVVPVPDQIRKLSDSIASFARPVKGEAKQEKF